MKKKLLDLAVASFILISMSACPSPSTNSTSSPNPSSSSSATPSSSPADTSVGASGSFPTKASFITYLNCIKAQRPALVTTCDAYIAIANDNWLESKDRLEMAADGLVKSFSVIGCK